MDLPYNSTITLTGIYPTDMTFSVHKKKIKPAEEFFKRFYLFISKEGGREGEREGEKHQCVVASFAPTIGDLAHNPGMCPEWESTWQPGQELEQASAQSTEPYQPGLHMNVYSSFIHNCSKLEANKIPSSR